MHTMTRILSVLLLGLLAAVVLAAAIALLLPASAHAERSIVIDAPQPSVFAIVNGFTLFREWSPWHALDPATEYSFDGPRHGVGAVMSWRSASRTVGSGSQRIAASEPSRLVRFTYEFGDRSTADAVITIEPEGEACRVTWSLDTEFGWNLVGRYFGLAFDRMIGPDFEQGLVRLKALAERLPREDWSDLQMSIEELEPIVIAVTAGEAAPGAESIAPALEAAYARVSDYLSQSGLSQAGPPVAITRSWDPEDGWSFFAGIPIAAAPATRPERDALVRVGQTPEGLTVVAFHRGPFDRLEVTHAAVDAVLAAYGYEPAGPHWEQYASDPGSTPADELITRICVPVR
jgi:effector-binding domain-containing protein/uncharacterized protein YndB with AHSA1/START domain